ncbi:YidB family protein [Methylobacterium nigriterrae]|uniref:YidB family protein n=1 Tax=Methylobacterium nigriterrae TaxID=3127512 RepID=UPI003D66999A
MTVRRAFDLARPRRRVTELPQARGPHILNIQERQTGLDRDTLPGQLAQVLPEVINGQTPHGRVWGPEERRGW